MAESNQTDNKTFMRLVLWTLSVLVVMTGLNILFIINSVGTNLFSPLKRNIASVENEEPINLEKFASPIIEINCQVKKARDPILTKASSARVFFKNCAQVDQLVNESNHDQGDLFPLANKEWTSDYLSLSPGQNRIKATIGDDVQIIEIKREIVKKKTSPKAL